MATAYIGGTIARDSSTGISADEILLRPASLREDAALEQIGFIPGITAAGARYRGVLYSAHPTTGLPDALLGETDEGVGHTVDVAVELAFPSAVALAKGTYWTGLHVAAATRPGYGGGTGVAWRLASQPYASGAPATWPGGGTALAQNYCIYGIYTNDGTLDAHTFGRLTTGASNLAVGGNNVTVSRFTLPEAGVVSHLTTQWDGAAAGGRYRGVIYASAGGEPGALLARTAEQVGAWARERIGLHFTAPVELAAGDYYLGIHTDASVFQRTDLTGTTRQKVDAYADGTADPWGATNFILAEETVIYASYTPGGGDPDPGAPVRRARAPIWFGW